MKPVFGLKTYEHGVPTHLEFSTRNGGTLCLVNPENWLCQRRFVGEDADEAFLHDVTKALHPVKGLKPEDLRAYAMQVRDALCIAQGTRVEWVDFPKVFHCSSLYWLIDALTSQAWPSPSYSAGASPEEPAEAVARFEGYAGR
jgi:hypothetical protein